MCHESDHYFKWPCAANVHIFWSWLAKGVVIPLMYCLIYLTDILVFHSNANSCYTCPLLCWELHLLTTPITFPVQVFSHLLQFLSSLLSPEPQKWSGCLPQSAESWPTFPWLRKLFSLNQRACRLFGFGVCPWVQSVALAVAPVR